MKILRSIAFILMRTAFMSAVASGSSAAQNTIPNEQSQPVIPPGKAGPQAAQGPNPIPASPALNVTIAEIMRNPEGYAGRNVTGTSIVEEAFTPWSFKLDERQLLAGGVDNDLLVISKEPLISMGFDPSWVHKKASVTGTVRILQAADYRREYGRDVDDKLFRRYEGKPALIATSMKRID